MTTTDNRHWSGAEGCGSCDRYHEGSSRIECIIVIPNRVVLCTMKTNNETVNSLLYVEDLDHALHHWYRLFAAAQAAIPVVVFGAVVFYSADTTAVDLGCVSTFIKNERSLWEGTLL